MKWDRLHEKVAMIRDLFSLFPACAGVILRFVRDSAFRSPFPRMCGGDPEGDLVPIYLDDFSPHVRG